MKLQLSLSLSLPSLLSPSLCPSCDTDGQLQSHCNLGGVGRVGRRRRGGRRRMCRKEGREGAERRDKDGAAAAAHAFRNLDGYLREFSISITNTEMRFILCKSC